MLPASAAADPEDKLNMINEQIYTNQKKIQEKKQKEKVALKDLIYLNRDLSLMSVKLTKAQYDLNIYKRRVETTQEQINKLQTAYNSKRDLLKKRIVQIYKNNHLGLLEFIFTSKDLMMVLNSSHMFEKILKSDVELISEMKSRYQELLGHKRHLTDQTKKIENLTSEITQHQQDLSVQQKKQNTYVSMLRQEIDDYERENQALLKASEEIRALILQRHGTEVRGTGHFIMPALGWVSSTFGYRRHPIFRRTMFHSGIDIAAPHGYEIRAADTGIVLYAGTWGGYGNATIIDHGADLTSVYGHQSRIVVTKGQKVVKGQLIGYVGSTGFSTGPHLHFEIRLQGRPVNPVPYIHG